MSLTDSAKRIADALLQYEKVVADIAALKVLYEDEDSTTLTLCEHALLGARQQRGELRAALLCEWDVSEDASEDDALWL